MQQWKTLKRELVLDHGKFLKVERHQIELPDGRIINDWPWIISPDYVLVLPETSESELLLFYQTKYAVKGTSLAPVGGYIEQGEEPLIAAQRELKEEMGCEAEEWIYFGGFQGNGNHGGGSGHFFLARNAHQVAQIMRDDLEEMEIVKMTIDEVEEKLISGEVKVQGWIAMIAMGILYLRRIAHH
ncbi:MAG TPA: NUDIX hydrolase [Bacteroidota bacterium]|nr:NUDIX hydrolase [Bacteroidota bacterium]